MKLLARLGVAAATASLMLVGAAVAPLQAAPRADLPAVTVWDLPVDDSIPEAPKVTPGTTQHTLVGSGGLKNRPPSAVRGAAQARLLTCTVCYYYNVGNQGFSSGTLPDGVFANFGWGAAAPVLAAGDYHTLVELAVVKSVGGLRQIVEVGARSAGSGMQIFVYHWIDDVPQGYGTNFTVVGTPTYAPGTSVGPGTGLTANIRFGIQYIAAGGGFPAAWWIAAYPVGGTAQWLGYFAASLWTGAGVSGYTNGDYIPVFGEIASPTATAASVCSGMGSETLATTLVGASLGSVLYPNKATGDVNLNVYEDPAGIHPYWNAEALGTPGNIRTFRFGGPGNC
jgi:hypothetical protein